MTEGLLIDECCSRKCYREFRKLYFPALKVEHVLDVMSGAFDAEILEHAKLHNLYVVTQDVRFSQRSDLVRKLTKKNFDQLNRKLYDLLWC